MPSAEHVPGSSGCEDSHRLRGGVLHPRRGHRPGEAGALPRRGPEEPAAQGAEQIGTRAEAERGKPLHGQDFHWLKKVFGIFRSWCSRVSIIFGHVVVLVFGQGAEAKEGRESLFCRSWNPRIGGGWKVGHRFPSYPPAGKSGCHMHTSANLERAHAQRVTLKACPVKREANRRIALTKGN